MKGELVKWLALGILCVSGITARKDELAFARCSRVADDCKVDKCEEKEEKECETKGWGAVKEQNNRGAARKVLDGNKGKEIKSAARKVVEGDTSSNVEVKCAAKRAIEAEIR